jgi:hypothetical protein
MSRSVGWSVRFAFSVLAGLAAAMPVSAASYKVTTLVSSSQCRPDLPSCTNWYFGAPGDDPVIDGDYVAFISRSTSPGGIYDGIWSVDLSSGAIKKLAGLETPVPGGTGNFEYFGGGASIGEDVVVFTGYDAASVEGIYTVRVAGGRVQEIINTNTTAPDGGTFTSWQQTRTNGRQVVFYAETSTGNQGVYAANIDGSGLGTLIDQNDQVNDQGRWSLEAGPGYYSVYMRPVIGNRLVSVYATEDLDPSEFPNAILQTSAFTDLADTLTALEADPTPQPAVHDVIGELSAAVDTDELAFYAADNGGAFSGIFAAATMGSAQAFATSETVLASGDQLAGFTGFARDKSGLAFAATDVADVQSIYFTPRAGGPIRLVADGSTYYVPTLGDRSLSGGRITFINGTIYENSIFLATPKN